MRTRKYDGIILQMKKKKGKTDQSEPVEIIAENQESSVCAKQALSGVTATTTLLCELRQLSQVTKPLCSLTFPRRYTILGPSEF